MADELNPYQGPEAAILDDFIAVEPRRRPMINFVAGAVCFGCSAFVLVIEGLCVWGTIDRWSRAGTKWENYPTRLGWPDFVLAPIGCSPLLFLLAGRSFWRVQGRRGVALFMVAIGALVSALLLPWLFH